MVIYIKTIGIIIRPFKENKKLFLGTRFDLFKTLTKFNVNTIGIPITNDFKNIKKSISFCDGIILSGGERIHKNDFKLVKYLKENNIPTLGICLGMQSMALNNTIDIPNHYSNKKYVHNILIKKNTLLYQILKKEKIRVNSRHHSALKKTNLKINALSPDNVIEGIEDNHQKFFLGLEWHPESINDNNSYLIFKAFINSL